MRCSFHRTSKYPGIWIIHIQIKCDPPVRADSAGYVGQQTGRFLNEGSGPKGSCHGACILETGGGGGFLHGFCLKLCPVLISKTMLYAVSSMCCVPLPCTRAVDNALF